jgi:hypothetical protein
VTLVPFPRRDPDPIAGLLGEYTLTKDVRVRRYVLRRVDRDRMVGEIWFGRGLHRSKQTVGVLDARRLADQFRRELQDLITDGWVLA